MSSLSGPDAIWYAKPRFLPRTATGSESTYGGAAEIRAIAFQCDLSEAAWMWNLMFCLPEPVATIRRRWMASPCREGGSFGFQWRMSVRAAQEKNEPAAGSAAGSWAYAIRLLAERPMNLCDQLTRTRGRGGGVIAGIGAPS